MHPSFGRYRHDDSSYMRFRTCGRGHGDADAGPGACRERSWGSKHRARARAVRGRIILVGGHSSPSGSAAERDFCADPADNTGRCGGGDPTRAGRQDRPTVLVGHSFTGMIVTEAGVDPRVSAVCSVLKVEMAAQLRGLTTAK